MAAAHTAAQAYLIARSIGSMARQRENNGGSGCRGAASAAARQHGVSRQQANSAGGIAVSTAAWRSVAAS